jgi:hypothetical protein
MMLFEVSLFGFICAAFLAARMFVCSCVVPKYGGVVIIFVMCAPVTVGSSPCLCSCVVYRSVYLDHIYSATILAT